LSLRSAAQDYDFVHYQVERGLSNNTVVCSTIDQKGFMWFGTKDGLDRFDGYTFKVFRKSLQDTTSLGNNVISTLYNDPDGILWVGTERGLFQYQYSTERFVHFKQDTIGSIRAILKDNQKNLWFISGLTLCRFSPDGRFKTYERNFEATTVCLAGNDIWVGTPQGYIWKYNKLTDTFTAYNVFKTAKPAPSHWIEKIYSDRPDRILIGTSNQGAKIFNTNTGTYIDLINRNEDGTDIFVRDFIRRSSNELWIATESGIFVYLEAKNQIINLKKQYNNPYSLSDNAVYTFCKDREGGVWVGTYFGGVNYYSPEYTNFKKIFPKTGKNSIRGNAVHEICKDKKGNLWIGTEDAGLNKLNIHTGLFTNYYPGDGRSGLINTNIHGLLISGNKLWIGTFEHGLDVMDLHYEKVIKHYNAGPSANQFKSNFIYCMIKTHSGAILLGTANGLYKYNPATDGFSPVKNMPPAAFYTTLMEDHNGTIWAGTFRDGVYHFNLKTGVTGVIQYDQAAKTDLRLNRITGIIESENHFLWITTEEGLFRFNPTTGQLKNFAIQNGSPGNLLYSILKDTDKQLWMGSSKGLVCFNTITGKIKTYTESNGLLTDQFNYNSAFRDSNGTMYFGSVRGLVSFNPAELVDNEISSPVYITGIQIKNQELKVGQNGSPLKKSIILSNKITLDYRSSSFSLDFSALSYVSPSTIQYAYKMEGLDEQWTLIKTNRRVYFTELPPGSYVFKVRVANGRLNNYVTTLMIQITPPFWKSPVAYIIYVVLSITLIIYIIHKYKQKLHTEHRRQLEIFENEKEKEIYEAKIEFFTNVAHEIRTPLTLIKAPMGKVIKRAEEVPAIAKSLRIMEKNTDRLLALTNQLLDFRSTEQKGFSLNFVKVDLTKLLREIWQNFQPAAERRCIQYKLSVPEKPFFAYVDPEALIKIVSNLLDNAIKYGRSRAEVHLLPPDENDSFFKIEVRNNGTILQPEDAEYIFEPFFRLKEHDKKQGTGIGLAISRTLAELHNGTLELSEPRDCFNIFVVTLPVHQLFEFNLSTKWEK
jgi:ligand-binding sensor domain-containing protein/signal transduction histidine kinase